MVSFENVKENSLKKLLKFKFESVKPKPNEKLRLKGPCALILYNNGRLLLQGSPAKIEECIKLLKYFCIIEDNLRGVAIGSDEALKGDTFGGIVVAAFKSDDEIRAQLKLMGVRDSKKLLKPEIVKMAQEIITKYPDNYSFESVLPYDYNKLNSRMTVTQILDLLHQRVYKKIAGRKSILHIVDQYPGCNVGDVKEVSAESKYLEVAAASVIARFESIKQIRALEQKAGFFIPFGSTHVVTALLELKKKSLPPEYYVKMKFKNVQDFFG